MSGQPTRTVEEIKLIKEIRHGEHIVLSHAGSWV